jgi:DNA-binding response OmpR family regulator
MSEKKKILIVDDEKINLDFFEVMLSKLGFEIEKAADGVEALEKVKAFSPDLILLDNIMPRMTGWEVTRILKGDTAYQDIPIIMLSAMDDVRDKVEGLEMGVEDYITKPFNFNEVLARIRAVLRTHSLVFCNSLRDDMLLEAKKSVNATKESFAALEKAWTTKQGDEAMEKAFGNIKESIKEMEDLIEKSMTLMQDIKSADQGLKELKL